MKKLTIAGVVGAVLLLAGCATSYQPEGLTGGFKETRLAQNMYRVSFQGNGYTDRERSADFTLLRSAELTLQSGYKYFVIIDANRDTTTSYSTTPTYTNTTANAYGNSLYANSTTYGGHTTTITKPSNSNTIIMHKTKPSVVFYDAKFITASIRNQYEIKKVDTKK